MQTAVFAVLYGFDLLFVSWNHTWLYARLAYSGLGGQGTLLVVLQESFVVLGIEPVSVIGKASAPLTVLCF